MGFSDGAKIPSSVILHMLLNDKVANVQIYLLSHGETEALRPQFNLFNLFNSLLAQQFNSLTYSTASILMPSYSTIQFFI